MAYPKTFEKALKYNCADFGVASKLVMDFEGLNLDVLKAVPAEEFRWTFGPNFNYSAMNEEGIEEFGRHLATFIINNALVPKALGQLAILPKAALLGVLKQGSFSSLIDPEDPHDLKKGYLLMSELFGAEEFYLENVLKGFSVDFTTFVESFLKHLVKSFANSDYYYQISETQDKRGMEFILKWDLMPAFFGPKSHISYLTVTGKNSLKKNVVSSLDMRVFHALLERKALSVRDQPTNLVFPMKSMAFLLEFFFNAKHSGTAPTAIVYIAVLMCWCQVDIAVFDRIYAAVSGKSANVLNPIRRYLMNLNFGECKSDFFRALALLREVDSVTGHFKNVESVAVDMVDVFVHAYAHDWVAMVKSLEPFKNSLLLDKRHWAPVGKILHDNKKLAPTKDVLVNILKMIEAKKISFPVYKSIVALSDDFDVVNALKDFEHVNFDPDASAVALAQGDADDDEDDINIEYRFASRSASASIERPPAAKTVAMSKRKRAPARAKQTIKKSRYVSSSEEESESTSEE